MRVAPEGGTNEKGIRMFDQNKGMKIFAANSHPVLAKSIASELGHVLSNAVVSAFSDGEISVSIGETVRGCDVFLIQSTCSPVNNNLMELLILADACKRASAGRVTAVMPYFGYARQDRKVKARDPISAKLVANLISGSGVDRVLTMDLHAAQIQGFFDIPVDHLLGGPILAPYFMKKFVRCMDEVTVVSPDLGSVARARNFAQKLGVGIAMIDKRRPRPNVCEVCNIIGDVKGKICILLDDMIDTAGTICNAAQALTEIGGAKSVYACATHAVLSGSAVERLNDAPFEEIVFLDTVPLPADKILKRAVTLSVSRIFAEAMERIHEELPVSTLFE